MSNYLPKENNAVMQQVGWLGASGRFYKLGTPTTEIHKTEPVSYTPVYEQIGTWEWNEAAKEWRVHYAD